MQSYPTLLFLCHGKATEYRGGRWCQGQVAVRHHQHQRGSLSSSVSESELPTFRAIQLGEDMTKFKPDDNKIEAENIKDSVSKLLAGELKQHQMSEEIPEDWDATGVKVLVEKNFHVVAMSALQAAHIHLEQAWGEVRGPRQHCYC